jgi:hypothetical protein
MEGYDFTITNEGSLMLVTANNDNAGEWADENIDSPVCGSTIPVEPRFISYLVEGIINSGFTVGDENGNELTVTDGEIVLVS